MSPNKALLVTLVIKISIGSPGHALHNPPKSSFHEIECTSKETVARIPILEFLLSNQVKAVIEH